MRADARSIPLVLTACLLPAGVLVAQSTNAPAPAAPALPASNAAPAAAAPTPPPAAEAPASAETAPAANPETYTVQSGDTLWDLSQKFHCSVKKLKELNHLKKNLLHPGQVLKIPPAKASAENQAAPQTTEIAAAAPERKISSSEETAPRAKAADHSAVASHREHAGEASSPMAEKPDAQPSAVSGDVPSRMAHADADVVPSKPKKKTSLASHATEGAADMAETAAPRHAAAEHPAKPAVADNEAETPKPAPAWRKAPAHPTPVAEASMPADLPEAKLDLRTPVYVATPASWGDRFLQEARILGDRGITYGSSWTPPGERHSWEMDCSNTSRYLYKVTTGIQLPRTASDQYYYLHQQNKAWDVPMASNGFADTRFLRQHLKPGDLLFWENTYKPERQPPITHVMVFLGTNAQGQWIMAGSQSGKGGEHNRRHGGPDIYVFNPTQASGGYSTWLGLSRHVGRFCAYGRPLEANAAKLAVAAND